MLEPGLAIEVKFIRAIDGDTVELEIVRRFQLRLRDIDTPELKEPKGREAQIYAHYTGTSAKKALAFIPANDPVKLVDINSFNRLVGDLYLDGHNLVPLLKDKGFIKHAEQPKAP